MSKTSNKLRLQTLKAWLDDLDSNRKIVRQPDWLKQQIAKANQK